MTTSEEQVPMSIEQRFEKKGHLYSTRTSEAFEAFDKRAAGLVILWVLRHPLEAGSEAADRFTQRIARLAGATNAIPKIQSYGVDARGNAHVAMDFVTGKLPFEERGDMRVLQHLFVECVAAVAALHKEGVVLGDIGDQSFILDDRRTVRLLGVLGTFEMEARQTAMLPPQHTLHYLSPEQRSGGSTDPAADVYALGVYGYKLFTGTYLTGDQPPAADVGDPAQRAAAPSIISPEAPRWVDDILGKCLEVRGSERFADAADLLIDLRKAISGVAVTSGGRWSRKTLIVTPQERSSLRQEALSSGLVKEVEQREKNLSPSLYEEREGSGARRKILFAAIGLVLSIVLAGFVLQLGGGDVQDAELVRELKYFEEVAPADLKPAINDVKAANVPFDRRRAALETIASSEDPIAFDLLEATVKSAPGLELKTAAQEYIVTRIKKQGFPRTGGVVERWVEAFAVSKKQAWESPLFRHVMRVGNTSKPLENRKFALKKVFEENEELGLHLAAALALDDPRDGRFEGVLRDFLKTTAGETDLEGKSVYLMILADPSLSVHFDHEIVDLVSQFSAGELAWALLFLAKNDNPLVFDVAEEVVERNTVAPFQAIFLKLLTDADRAEVKKPVKIALVRAARGEANLDDVHALGRWYNQSAERALLGVAAIAPNEDVAVEAFDTLAARTLNTEPAAALVEWIKKNYWKYRKKVAKAIGILGLIDIASPEQIEYAFDRIVPFAGSGSFLNLIVQTGNSKIIIMSIDRIGEIIGSDELLELLRHQNKEIRIASIAALAGRNQLQVLQAIHRAYEKETDEEVREAYRTHHWVTKDRK